MEMKMHYYVWFLQMWSQSILSLIIGWDTNYNLTASLNVKKLN